MLRGVCVAGSIFGMSALTFGKWQLVASLGAVVFRTVGGPTILSSVLRTPGGASPPRAPFLAPTSPLVSTPLWLRPLTMLSSLAFIVATYVPVTFRPHKVSSLQTFVLYASMKWVDKLPHSPELSTAKQTHVPHASCNVTWLAPAVYTPSSDSQALSWPIVG